MVSQRADGGVPKKALVALSEVMLISCGKGGGRRNSTWYFPRKKIERENNIIQLHCVSKLDDLLYFTDQIPEKKRTFAGRRLSNPPLKEFTRI